MPFKNFLKVPIMSKIARALLISMCFAIPLATTTPVFAKKKPGTHRISKKPGGSTKESADERRLKRECKGQVNAGACAGYTR